METVQQNGRFTLFSSKFLSNIYSILFVQVTLYSKEEHGSLRYPLYLPYSKNVLVNDNFHLSLILKSLLPIFATEPKEKID